MNKDIAFKLDIKVRFRDLDALGHVNNSVYFTYFEEGRKHLVEHVYRKIDPYEFMFILAHVSCDYIKPVTMRDRLTLHMTVGGFGRKSFVFNYELTDRNDTGKVFAKGESVQVCFDYETNESLPVSDELKRQFSAHTED